MRFKLDENLPDETRRVLTALGHDVHTVADEGLSGAVDSAVMAACIAEGRLLVTLDLDFADIRLYPPGTHPGIWVLRPRKQTFRAVAELAVAGTRLATMERTAGQLWIIDENRVRIRDAGDA